MKKILVGLVIILMLFSVVSVNAQDLKTINFTANKTEIKKGEEVKLTITSNELTGVEGKIKYDTSVWTLSNKTSQNSFTLNEETGKFALVNLTGEEKVEAIITLTSKKDTKVDSSIITVSEITASNKTGESFEISDKEVTIKFEKEVALNSNPNEIEPNGKTEKEEYKEIIQTNTNAPKLPDTGSENTLIVITLLTIISTVLYIRYKKYSF